VPGGQVEASLSQIHVVVHRISTWLRVKTPSTNFRPVLKRVMQLFANEGAQNNPYFVAFSARKPVSTFPENA